MSSDRIRSAFPYFPAEDIALIQEDVGRILRTGRLILGPFLQQFEAQCAEYVGTSRAVGLSSCTAALEATLRYLRVEGGEVVVPTNTFVATANAVIYAGARPVFADIDGDALALDPADLERRLTPRTKAVIVVHIAGTISPHIRAIRRLCDSRRIPLIEDAAHAHGATFEGQQAGSFGFAGCFSMYPTKVLTTGCGGVVTTDDVDLAEYCSVVRHHGAGSRGLTVPEHHGNDWIMNEISAAIGVRQLARLDEFVAQRNVLAAIYRDAVAASEHLFNLPLARDARNSYYKYIVIAKHGIDGRRVLDDASKTHNVELAQVYFPPCHLQPIFRAVAGQDPLPNAEDILPRAIALPMHVGLAAADVERAVAVLDRLCEGVVAWS